MYRGGRPLSSSVGAKRGDTNGFLMMGQEVGDTKAWHSDRRGAKPSGYSRRPSQLATGALLSTCCCDLLGVDSSERRPPEVCEGSRKDWIQLEAPWVRSLSSTAVSLPRDLRLFPPTVGCTAWQSVPGGGWHNMGIGWNRGKTCTQRTSHTNAWPRSCWTDLSDLIGLNINKQINATQGWTEDEVDSAFLIRGFTFKFR